MWFPNSKMRQLVQMVIGGGCKTYFIDLSVETQHVFCGLSYSHSNPFNSIKCFFFYFALSHNIDQRLSKNTSNSYEQSNSKMTKSNLMSFCLSKSCISSTLHLRISHGSIVLFRKATSLKGIPIRYKVTSLNGIPTRYRATNLFLFQSHILNVSR